MATNAGMVQAKDIKQGRTFYQVVLMLKEHGEFTVEIRPVYCGSKLWLQNLQEFKGFTKPSMHINSYRDKPLFSFGYKNFEKAKRDGCGNMFYYIYTQSFTTNTMCFYRLFTTRKFAERFAENLRKTFKLTDEQEYHVIYHYRWERDWEKREMSSLFA